MFLDGLFVFDNFFGRWWSVEVIYTEMKLLLDNSIT